MKKYCYLLLIVFISCNTVKYERIVKVHDADTATTESGLVLRFNKIDAPELTQTFGKEARLFVANLILNKTVKIVTHGTDKYGRTIADIYVNGIYVNEEEVKGGYCWVYWQYGGSRFYNEERQARKNKVGLWALNEQIPPFLYRKQLKNK